MEVQKERGFDGPPSALLEYDDREQTLTAWARGDRGGDPDQRTADAEKGKEETYGSEQTGDGSPCCGCGEGILAGV